MVIQNISKIYRFQTFEIVALVKIVEQKNIQIFPEVYNIHQSYQ